MGRGASGPPLILAYHSIYDSQPGISADDVITTPAELEHDVRTLQAQGYSFCTAEELGGQPPPPGTATLTFDDGWRDSLTVTAPLLRRLGVRATFYLCPGLFGNHDPRMGEAGRILTESEARDLRAAGMELGAHSMTHPDLRTLDDGALHAELADSKAAVEEIAGSECRTLAYPFGTHDGRVRREAARTGFQLGLTYSPGPWSPLAAPRVPGPLMVLV